MNHEYYTRKDCPYCSSPDYDNCNICEGGLSWCKVCNLAEGELTTECPGEDSTLFKDATYAGNMDFIDGRWLGHPESLNNFRAEIDAAKERSRIEQENKPKPFSMVAWMEN